MTDRRTLPAHENCHHKKYWLTCKQYEDLIEACGNCCQVCRRPAAECAPHRKLYIDHDQHYGVWAVRGLLCPRCNGVLRTDFDDPEWASKYLANPWFKRVFAEMGVSIEPPPEPPIGSYFQSPRGTTWTREKDRWQNQSFARASRTWRRMCMEFSPADLQHVHIAVPRPRSVKISIRPDSPTYTASVLSAHMSLERRKELAFLLLGD